MPADTRAEHVHPGSLQLAGQLVDLLLGLAPLDQIQHGDAVIDDEVLGDRGAYRLHDLDGEAHPLLRGATPVISALIRPLREELVDQVALGAHDLDAVVAGLLGILRRLAVGLDRRANLLVGELAGRERGDRGLGRGRGHRHRVIAVAAGVQQLQDGQRTTGVGGLGDLAVGVGDLLGVEGLTKRRQVPFQHRRVATSHDGCDAALRALAEEFGQLRGVLELVLEAGVHGTHDHAVAESLAANLEGGEHRWVLGFSRRTRIGGRAGSVSGCGACHVFNFALAKCRRGANAIKRKAKTTRPTRHRRMGSMQQKLPVVPIRDAEIRLGQFLKLANLVETGGMAKDVLAEGAVSVNGAAETRRGKALRDGDQVTITDPETGATVGAEVGADGRGAADSENPAEEDDLGEFFDEATADDDFDPEKWRNL